MAGLQIVLDLIDNTGQALQSVGGNLASLAPAAGAAGLAVTAAFAATAVAATAAAFEIGKSYDEAFDSIRVSTGKVGDELVALQTGYKNVFASVPDDAAEVSAAFSTLAQRTGESGEQLETLTTSVLNFQRLDPTSNIEDLTRTFEQWNIAGDQQVTTMDKLLRATQKTGVGAGTLESALVKNRVVLQGLGLDFDHATALIATFEREGVNTQQALAGLSKGFANAAKDGKDAGTFLRETFDTIKNAPSDIAATGLAVEIFGAKGGPELAAAIREGRVSVDELAESIGDISGDTIANATKDTEDFAEAWTKFSRRVLNVLEPVGTAVFNLAGLIFDKLTPALDSLTASLAPLAVGFGAVMSLLTEGDPEKRIEFFNTLSTVIGGDLAEKVALVTSGLVGLVGALSSGDPEGVTRIANALDGLFGEGTTAKVFGVVDAFGQAWTMMGNFMAIAGEAIAPIAGMVDWIGILQIAAVGIGVTIAAMAVAFTLAMVGISGAIAAAATIVKTGFDLMRGAQELFKTAVETAWSFFQSVNFGTLVEEWKTSFMNGLQGMIDGAKEKLATLRGLLPSSLAKDGPLSVAVKWDVLFEGMPVSAEQAIARTRTVLKDAVPVTAGGRATPAGAGVGFSVYSVDQAGGVRQAGGAVTVSGDRATSVNLGGVTLNLSGSMNLNNLNEGDLAGLAAQLGYHLLKVINDGMESTAGGAPA